MKMRAIVATAKGGPEVLELQDVELPWPGLPRDVLIRLSAAALNPADSFFRQFGGYVTGPAPLVLGHDGAGIVEEVGAEVTAVRPGDCVCFCNGGIGAELGTYAEYAVVPEERLATVPAGVEIETAAALPLVAITAWEALYDRAGVSESEHVLIHAGAGGTGHVAVQLAVLRGARVATTISSADKMRLVEELGAELPINYRERDFIAEVIRWSGGGAAVALDNVGGRTMLNTYRAMAPYGRIVTLMGIPGDDTDTTAYNQNLTLHNVMMLTPMWKKLRRRLAEQTAILREVLALAAVERLRVHISARLPLRDAPEAHALMDRGGNIGKIVLTQAA
jgi:NADPH2:quinone reductase